jgi:hypothetical protein
VVDLEHFAPLFGRKPRAQVMLYRTALLELGDVAARYVSEVPHRHRARLREEILALHALVVAHGASAVLATPAHRPRALPALPLLALPGVPHQCEIDRQLSQYEADVHRSSALMLADAAEVPA